MDQGRTNQLGKYSLVAEIARGGMGVVYLAQAIGRHGFKKLVVVKLLKPELAEDEKFREMFLDEARLAARLNHRNIVQTLEVEQEDDRYFFVMEYLEGRTLHAASLLKGERALPVTTTLWILCDVLAGLHYAHELADFDGKPLGVVHRDVSPRNVFLTYDGQVKVLDFGVAKAAGRGQETEAGELKGRIPYMSPEHVRDKDIDRRADVFSVGVLLREALTGRRLWEGANEVEILSRLLERDLPALPSDVEIPDEARTILERAMAPDRDARYRTAHEMRSALERYVSRLDKTGATAKFGEPISKAFAEHRSQLKELIEQHVAHAESMPPAATGSVPALPREFTPAAGSSGRGVGPAVPPGPTSSSPVVPVSKPAPAGSSGSRAASPPAPSSGSSVERPPASARGPTSSPDPTSSRIPRAGAIPASLAPPEPPPPGRPSLAVKKPPISMPPVPQKPRIGLYLVLGLAFLGVVAGLTLFIRTMDEAPAKTVREDTPPPMPTPTERRRGTPLPQPSASAEPEDVVEVTLRAMPPIADLWIDDVHVGQGPHTQKFKRDTKHFVRASAAGYVSGPSRSSRTPR
jgi:serine/threonine-protein kinase